MKKNKLVIILVFTAMAYVPIRLLIPKELERIGPYVLFLTLLAILWYSWETSQLRIQQRDIMELSLQPHLEAVFQRAHFRLHNMGNGPALNVRIDDEIVAPGGFPERLKFMAPAIIRKDESLPIYIRVLTEDGKHEISSSELGFIRPPLAMLTVEIKVYYENLSGKKYVRELRVGKDMFINADPVDFLLQYLYEQYERYPRPIHPNEISAAYVASYDVMRHIHYCHDKGLVKAVTIKTDKNGVVEYDLIEILPDGIDYLKSTN